MANNRDNRRQGQQPNQNPRLPAEDEAVIDETQPGAHETHETHLDSRGHDSRVDELSEERATHPVHDMPWVRPSSLEAPPPRPGMAQRWIRITVRGEDDPRNVSMRMREGWQPRKPDTISEDFLGLGSQAGLSEGRYIVDDLMLCEMPQERYEMRQDYFRRETEQQMMAVETDLEDAQVPGHPIQKTHKSSVSHPPRVLGRRAEAAADD